MSSSQPPKQYGLIKKPLTLQSSQNKGGNVKTIKKPFMFNNDDDDDDDDDDIKNINDNDISAIKRANQLILSSKSNNNISSTTLVDDISIYDYDGSYDAFKSNNVKNTSDNHPLLSSEGSSNLPKPKPKYIESIIATSKIREKEQERMKERKLIRERQKEDELYGDTEKFMTSAYKKKLEEEKKWEYEEKLTEIVEQKTDYRSRGMHGFYSNLMNKNVSTGAEVSSNALSAYTAGSLRQNQLDTNQNIESNNVKSNNDNNLKYMENNNDSNNNNNNDSNSNKRSIEESNKYDDNEILKKQRTEVADESESVKTTNSNKQTKEESIMSARERFLARKNKAV